MPVPDPPTNIPGDSVLSAHGEDQAEELGEFLKNIEPPVDRIYSSPLYRCLQTSVPASEKLGLPIYPETGFGEWYKRETDLHPSAASPQELKAFFPTLKEDYRSLVSVSNEGETVEEHHKRCKDVFRAVLKDIREHGNNVKTILVVTHAAPRIALGRALAGDNSLQIRTGTCSIDKFVLKAGKEPMIGNYDLEYTGKCDYLKDGEEMHWSFDSPYEPGSVEDINSRFSDSETSGDGEATVTVYVPLDMGQDTFGPLSESVIPAQAPFQAVEFDSDKPMFKIGENVFQGEWQDMVGTEVYTDVEGKSIGTSRTRIQLFPSTLQEKSEQFGAGAKKESLVDRIKKINLARAQKKVHKKEDGP